MQQRAVDYAEVFTMEYWLLYLATGVLAGFLAGLFGVGGGLVIVPVLTFIFTAQHFPQEHIVHLALGTSLASILFTSLSSVRSHQRHNAVNWDIVKRITPGILMGTFLGTAVAALLSTLFLKVFFAAFEFFAATQMILNIKPKPTRDLPGIAGMGIAGITIGMISSLVGIGGGTLSVPFMVWCNVKLHEAIGTSSAIGFPIALAGAIGFWLNGTSAHSLPPSSLGFIYLPALIGLVIASIMTAPLGAKLAHRLPVKKLKTFFALWLYLLGFKMLWSLL